MAVLRKTWQRALHHALLALQHSTNPVAQFTWQIINEKRVIIAPYDGVIQQDFRQMIHDYFGKNVPFRFPPSKELVGLFNKKWEGCIYDNRIYIANDITDPYQKQVLIHEVNHFVNQSNSHYHTKEDKMREELRAYLAERMAESGPLTRQAVRVHSDFVKNFFRYRKVPPPTLPPGTYYPSFKPKPGR